MTFIVFGKAACPACHSAKFFLEKNNRSYRYFDIVEDDQALSVLRGLLPQVKTVPQIFTTNDSVTTLQDVLKVNREYVGGFSELQTYFKDNE